MVAKDCCAFFLSFSTLKHCRKTIAMENVIPENKSNTVITDEVFAYDKGLSQAIWTWLYSVGKGNTKL